MNNKKKETRDPSLDQHSNVKPHEEWLDAKSTEGAEQDLEQTT